MSLSDPAWRDRKPSFVTEDNGVTYLIVSGAGAAVRTADRVETEMQLGRCVHVVATPNAHRWLEDDAIEKLTGWRPRSETRLPSEPQFEPPGSRVIASPVTLNTLTKWAYGHADNLALSLLCEAIGIDGVSVTAEIHLSKAYARHPEVAKSVATLQQMGVEVLRKRGTGRVAGIDLPTA